MVSLRSRTRTRLVVLVPAQTQAPDTFSNPEIDPDGYDRLMAEMQRLRGSVYVRDGAVRRSDLTLDGRHRLAVDKKSWHVLSLDRDDNVCACLRYVDETWAGGFDDLWIRNAAFSRVSALSHRFRRAVEVEMHTARRMGMRFGEVGGWAVAENQRATFEPLRIILATYGLLRLLGGVRGVATATFRHDSAPILRRIGLNPLVGDGVELPSYFDPHYGCRMEALQFDSRYPAARYEDWVGNLADALRVAPAICREPSESKVQSVLARLELAHAPEPVLSW
ncbi:MAG TPA: hypothetical protein VMS37_24485 [Verrucomicrobiae bacterium]|nr:hypothetical protein [Verrucomicrobiae bacterium]